jgi:HAD superfamily phosphoserine phosphatase-like hydrolase
MNLALFDFDGTITFKDSFKPFLLYAAGRTRRVVGTLLFLPLIVAYRFGMVSASKTRATIAGFAFRGRLLAQVQELGSTYARDVLPTTVRPRALERIEWHKARGDRVVVVSAALCVYLAEWCRQMDLEVICTEFETRDGKITGRYHMLESTSVTAAGQSAYRGKASLRRRVDARRVVAKLLSAGRPVIRITLTKDAHTKR